MKDSFKTFIEGINTILVLLPVDPQFDQVAAGLGLYLGLSAKKGREVMVVSPSPMVVEYNRLVGVNKVSDKMGNKNLVVRLAGYEVEKVERITSDIEDGELFLKVVPKPNMTPPTKEQVVCSYSGVNAEVAILVGGENEKQFPALAEKDLLDVKLAHIGTEGIKLPAGRQVISFARPASSISEVMAELVCEVVEELDHDMATNLLMGIYEGSKNFSDPGVTQETFLTAGELMKAGGRVAPKVEAKARMFPRGAGMMMPVGQAMGQGQMTAMPLDRPNLEKPDVETTEPPRAWTQTPKIYKGTSVS